MVTSRLVRPFLALIGFGLSLAVGERLHAAADSVIGDFEVKGFKRLVHLYRRSLA